MKRTYSIRKNGELGRLQIDWPQLNPRWSEQAMYGPPGRYMHIGYLDGSPSHYLRNPHGKPLLHNGRKPR